MKVAYIDLRELILSVFQDAAKTRKQFGEQQSKFYFSGALSTLAKVVADDQLVFQAATAIAIERILFEEELTR